MLSYTNLAKDFFLHCIHEKGLSQNTLKAYKIDLSQFGKFLTTQAISGVESINKIVLKSYIQVLTTDYKTKSAKRKIATLKAFFSYLEFEEIINENPFRKVRTNLRVEKTIPNTLSAAEVRRVLVEIHGKKKGLDASRIQYRLILRDIAVVELLFATGVRVSELCALKAEHVSLDSSSGTIKVVGKGNKERLLFVGGSESIEALLAYRNENLETITATGHFFINRLKKRLSPQSVRTIINQVCKDAGITRHITPHAFRHTFATQLLEQNVNIRFIQSLLGHSSILTTQIYTHVSAEMQRDILQKNHPRISMKVT